MLDPKIEAVREKYGLSDDDFWQIPQNKQWVCKHAALEIVAVKAKIEFEAPQVIEANAPELVTSMVVVGHMGDRVEWSTGETNPTNYVVRGKQPAYPWAMSEKRAKDRVILKLVGLHGFVYSEDEGDFTQSKAKSRDLYQSLVDDINGCTTIEELGKWWRDREVQGLVKSLPHDWQEQIVSAKDTMKVALEKAVPRVAPNFDDLPQETQEAVENLSA
jgi:hypothetical protein